MSRPTLRQQYEELDLLYRESRNWLAQLERMEKRSPEERRGKALRLLVLRAARDTLYRLAIDAPGGAGTVHPADYEAIA